MSTKMAQDLYDEVVPMPYVEGAALHLEIIHGYQDNLLPRVTAASIDKILDVSLSPVMRVTITLDSGSKIHAVLKLYDHRFGENLRSNGKVYWPHTTDNQSSFEDFVSRNAIGPFLTNLNHLQETAPIPIRPWHHLDGNVGQSRKFEAALWQECTNRFNFEVKAYEHLKDLQGTGIPRLLASVRLVGASSAIPKDLINESTAKYWDVKGVLLQYIPGISLINLDSSSIDTREWQNLIQRTVDLVHKINKAGVVMDICSPRNVIVNEKSLEPFFIDFAQSWLKDELKIPVHMLLESGTETEKESDVDRSMVSEEGDSFDLEAEYLELVRDLDNAGAIGAVMAAILQRRKNIKIQINCRYGGPL